MTRVAGWGNGTRRAVRPGRGAAGGPAGRAATRLGAVGGADAPAHARRGGGPGASAAARRAAAAARGRRHGRVGAPLRPARHREDHDRAATGRPERSARGAALRRALGALLGRAGAAPGDRGRASSARPAQPPDRAVHRRGHRFSKTQQDALLGAVEDRLVLLVAATTENPSFSVVSPLLSRSLVLRLESLTDDDVRVLLRRAVAQERGLAGAVVLAPECQAALGRLAGGRD